MGASIVLVQTRSGSSEFHGALWEYLRNDAFDARNFFSPGVLPLKQNIFGGTLGGPVLHSEVVSQRQEQDVLFLQLIPESISISPARYSAPLLLRT